MPSHLTFRLSGHLSANDAFIQTHFKASILSTLITTEFLASVIKSFLIALRFGRNTLKSRTPPWSCDSGYKKVFQNLPNLSRPVPCLWEQIHIHGCGAGYPKKRLTK